MTSPIRWGIISTAAIAENHVVPALHAAAGHEVVAVGSRDADRASQWARNNGIPKAYGSYEELLNDDEVEAVYNPLPNHLHVDWSIAALRAGKHVLCEKPLGCDQTDAQRLVDVDDAHPELVTMEAFMYRFHPQWIAVQEMVGSGRIGELKTIQTWFSYFNDDPANVRHNPDWGGGALLDIGCYPISQARWLFGREPERVVATIENDPAFGTDRLTSGMLDFGSGQSATFTVATQLEPFQRTQVVGTNGRIEIDIPVNSPRDTPTIVTVTTGGNREAMEFGPVDQYGCQADAFGAAVRGDKVAPTPLSDAIANMAVIDALFQSASDRTWVTR
ncbi:MAG: Gfo/Idh/MocA family protein [Acidimicrobiales bacterium]